MTFRGTIKKGVVVFSKSPRLKDGTVVRVQPIQPPKRSASSRKKRSFHPVGRWEGEPGELEKLLAQVQQARETDLELERDAWR